jgi:hypothetical protein
LPQPSVARSERGRKRGESGKRGKSGRERRVEEWKSGRETEERETTWVEDMVSWYESKQPQHTTPQHTTPQHPNTPTQHPNTFTPWFTNLLGW